VRRYELDLRISDSELLRYYRGAVSDVVAFDRYGRKIRFPASALRPFVTRTGIQGRFVLEVDADNRLRGIRMIEPR
jgi:hypothetical protein